MNGHGLGLPLTFNSQWQALALVLRWSFNMGATIHTTHTTIPHTHTQTPHPTPPHPYVLGEQISCCNEVTSNNIETSPWLVANDWHALTFNSQWHWHMHWLRWSFNMGATIHTNANANANANALLWSRKSVSSPQPPHVGGWQCQHTCERQY